MLSAERTILAKRPVLCSVQGFALGVLFVFAGCAGSLQPGVDDTAIARVDVPVADVRTALTQILEEQGYTVSDSEDGLRTGYRRETESPWDWLLRSRLGVSRGQVQALLVGDATGATTVTVLVRYEGKKWLWAPWETAPPPLEQSAVNQLRLLRNRLGLPDVRPQPASPPSSSSSLSAIPGFAATAGSPGEVSP